MSHAGGTEPLCEIPLPPRRRRRRLWVGVAVLLFVVWLGIMYGFFVYWTGRELREVVAATDRENPEGWELEDIEAHREQIPDEENAALVVLHVKSLLPAGWPLKTGGADASAETSWTLRFGSLPPEVVLDPDLLQSLRSSLAELEPARAEAHKLIGMTRGRYPLVWAKDVSATQINSQPARTASNLLHYEAALASQEGNADQAVALVRGLVGAARSVGDEPLLISALIRLACDAEAVDALERALAQGEPANPQLEMMQALLEKEAVEPFFTNAMRGERAGLHKMVLSLRQGDVGLSQFGGFTGKPGIAEKLMDFSGPTLARRSHATMLRLMNEYVRVSQMPLEQQAPMLANLNREVMKAKVEYDVVTAMLMPAIGKVAQSQRRGVGNLRCASVGMALERYRRDDGRWPDTLDALVPRYLAAVPTDPYDGKPLRYQRRPDGVVVYWVGEDGTDDGGKINRNQYWTKGTDQGFQLWNVPHRRQPARETLAMPMPEPMP